MLVTLLAMAFAFSLVSAFLFPFTEEVAVGLSFLLTITFIVYTFEKDWPWTILVLLGLSLGWLVGGLTINSISQVDAYLVFGILSLAMVILSYTASKRGTSKS